LQQHCEHSPNIPAGTFRYFKPSISREISSYASISRESSSHAMFAVSYLIGLKVLLALRLEGMTPPAVIFGIKAVLNVKVI
jgi:hypothetical protein